MADGVVISGSFGVVLMRLTCIREGCGTRIWIDWKDGTQETTLGAPTTCLHCGSPLLREWGRGHLAFVCEPQLRPPPATDPDDTVPDYPAGG
jgi:hypothetical protein